MVFGVLLATISLVAMLFLPDTPSGARAKSSDDTFLSLWIAAGLLHVLGISLLATCAYRATSQVQRAIIITIILLWLALTAPVVWSAIKRFSYTIVPAAM